jgi:hypothetical protein
VTNHQFAGFVVATGYRTQAEREGSAPVFVMPIVPVWQDDPRARWKLIPCGLAAPDGADKRRGRPCGQIRRAGQL